MKRERADVPSYQPKRPGSTPGRPLEHRRGPIDPGDRMSGTRERYRDPAGAASQFEQIAARPFGKPDPKRHVAAP
jgi:hypothetical protein